MGQICSISPDGQIDITKKYLLKGESPLELIQNRISQIKEVVTVSREHEESTDIIVPDVCPDTLGIVYVDGSCTLREKQVGAGTVTVSGDIFIRVFYESEEPGRLCILSGQMPYTVTLDAPVAGAGDKALASVRVLEAGASALNPRKLSLRAALGVELQIYQPTELTITEGASGSAEEGIHVRTVSEVWRYPGDLVEKKLAFNEEIRLPDGGPIAEGDRVAAGDLIWQADDIRVLEGKVMVRGSAVVTVLCLPEMGSAVSESRYKLPFSMLLECDSLSEHDSVDLRFQTLQLDTQLVTRGEGERFLYCSIFGAAAALVNKERTVNRLEDLYSTTFGLTYDTTEVTIGPPEPHTICQEGGATLETMSPARRICHVSWKGQGRGQSGSVAGCFCFKIIYEDVDGRICSVSRRIEVEATAEGAGPGSHVAVEAQGIETLIDSAGAVQVSFTAAFTYQPGAAVPYTCIKSASLQADKPLGRARDASLVLRAPEEGESVWSIAKQYRTDPAAIRSANGLPEDTPLLPGKLMIIPFVQ